MIIGGKFANKGLLGHLYIIKCEAKQQYKYMDGRQRTCEAFDCTQFICPNGNKIFAHERPKIPLPPRDNTSTVELKKNNWTKQVN